MAEVAITDEKSIGVCCLLIADAAVALSQCLCHISIRGEVDYYKYNSSL